MSAADDPKDQSSPPESEAQRLDIDGFRQGDPSCCRQVLDEFSPLIWSVTASYVHDPSDRKDVYQEICARILERRTQFSGRGSLAGWVNKTAHRWCMNWRRAQQLRQAGMERYRSEVMAVGEPSRFVEDPLLLLCRQEFMKQLRVVLAKLPQKQADAFILVRMKGYTTNDAAEIMKVRAVTVRSNLRYAHRKLRRELRQFEDGLS